MKVKTIIKYQLLLDNIGKIEHFMQKYQLFDYFIAKFRDKCVFF